MIVITLFETPTTKKIVINCYIIMKDKRQPIHDVWGIFSSNNMK